MRKLWANGEGRLLLTNIANQLDNGVIGHDEIAPFLRRARHREADFSTRGSALAYTQEDLDQPDNPSGVLKGRLCTQIADDTFFLRVAPFQNIIDNIVFYNKDDVRTTGIKPNLSRLLEVDISNDEAHQTDSAIKGYLSKYAKEGGEPSRWKLPPEVAALSPVACRFGMRSIRLIDKAKGEPVFVAPVVGGGRTLVPLFQSLDADGIADAFRDRLGLDDYDWSYKKKMRTVIGGILFRKNQIVETTFHRPTPFDYTSKARFRGAYGAYDAGRGAMGRAADLALAGGGAASPGCAELVAKDGHFASNDSEVLIFYFGPVKNPRNDHYQAGQWRPEDDAFAEGCLGKGRHTRVLARIVLAALRVDP
ncbi:MAG: hypothetical protein ACRBBV_18350 [Paracoccaceae bacterium]